MPVLRQPVGALRGVRPHVPLFYLARPITPRGSLIKKLKKMYPKPTPNLLIAFGWVCGVFEGVLIGATAQKSQPGRPQTLAE
jgi:hypothetical protein